MKYLPLVCAIFAYAIPQCQPTDFADKSESITSLSIINAAGGDGIGEGGSIAFSVGQIFYKENLGQDSSIIEGMQQPTIENKNTSTNFNQNKNIHLS